VYTVQAVSPQVTLSHPPGGRLPLLSARPAVTSVVFLQDGSTHSWLAIGHLFSIRLPTNLSTPKGRKAELAWLAACSRWFTHNSGHSSATG